MAFYKKPVKYHYITQEDLKRLQEAEQSDVAKARKFKAQVEFERDGLSQTVLIYVYGETKEQIKLEIAEHLKNFKSENLTWRIKKTKLLKGEAQSEEHEDEK